MYVSLCFCVSRSITTSGVVLAGWLAENPLFSNSDKQTLSMSVFTASSSTRQSQIVQLVETYIKEQLNASLTANQPALIASGTGNARSQGQSSQGYSVSLPTSAVGIIANDLRLRSVVVRFISFWRSASFLRFTHP
jgi:hypothetical protein